jgi:hypothetical protein
MIGLMHAKKPAPKRKPKQDDPEQSKLFIETARAIGSDETGRAFKGALKKIAPRKKPTANRA